MMLIVTKVKSMEALELNHRDRTLQPHVPDTEVLVPSPSEGGWEGDLRLLKAMQHLATAHGITQAVHILHLQQHTPPIQVVSTKKYNEIQPPWHRYQPWLTKTAANPEPYTTSSIPHMPNAPGHTYPVPLLRRPIAQRDGELLVRRLAAVILEHPPHVPDLNKIQTRLMLWGRGTDILSSHTLP